MGKNRPPSYYITLELEEYIVHNCMIDSMVFMRVMPEKVSDIMLKKVSWHGAIMT